MRCSRGRKFNHSFPPLGGEFDKVNSSFSLPRRSAPPGPWWKQLIGALVLNITLTVSRLRNRMDLQVHFKFTFNIFFLQHEEFFPKNVCKTNQTEVAPNMKVFTPCN